MFYEFPLLHSALSVQSSTLEKVASIKTVLEARCEKQEPIVESLLLAKDRLSLLRHSALGVQCSTLEKVSSIKMFQEARAEKQETRLRCLMTLETSFPNSTFCTGCSAFNISLDPVFRISYFLFLHPISNLRNPALTPSQSAPPQYLSRLDRVLNRVLPHTLSAFQRHHGR